MQELQRRERGILAGASSRRLADIEVRALSCARCSAVPTAKLPTSKEWRVDTSPPAPGHLSCLRQQSALLFRYLCGGIHLVQANATSGTQSSRQPPSDSNLDEAGPSEDSASIEVVEHVARSA